MIYCQSWKMDAEQYPRNSDSRQRLGSNWAPVHVKPLCFNSLLFYAGSVLAQDGSSLGSCGHKKQNFGSIQQAARSGSN